MPLISVIVPVYNAEAYLRRCIESILNQTFTDFELILVDDGSPDGSGAICDDYASKDHRIRVIHQKNQGVSAARNAGINDAIGEWMTFIDSDDYVAPSLLTTLHESQTKYHSDFVLSGHIKILHGEIIDTREYPDFYLSSADFGVLFDKGLIQRQKGPCSKLYKTKIIKDNAICFDEMIHAGEDALFVYTYLVNIDSLSIAPGADYLYDLHQGSLTTLGLCPYDKELHGFNHFREVLEQLLEKISTNSKYPLEFLTYWQERVLGAIYQGEYSRKERISKLKRLDLELFAKWKKCNTWKEFILNKVLVLHLFYLYDILRSNR